MLGERLLALAGVSWAITQRGGVESAELALARENEHLARLDVKRARDEQEEAEQRARDLATRLEIIGDEGLGAVQPAQAGGAAVAAPRQRRSISRPRERSLASAGRPDGSPAASPDPVQALAEAPGEMARRHAPVTPNTAPLSHGWLPHQIFTLFDRDGDGMLNQEEYADFCTVTEPEGSGCDDTRWESHRKTLGADGQPGLTLEHFALLYLDSRFK